MNETIRKVGAGTASLCLVGSAAIAATPAVVEFVSPDSEAGIALAARGDQTMGADELDGQFAYEQNQVTPNSVIKRVFLKVSTVCASLPDYRVGELSPKISVGGDVENPIVATVDDNGRLHRGATGGRRGLCARRGRAESAHGEFAA